jgi:hypothetical protein
MSDIVKAQIHRRYVRNRCSEHNEVVFCGGTHNHKGDHHFPEPGTVVIYRASEYGLAGPLDREWAELVWREE